MGATPAPHPVGRRSTTSLARRVSNEMAFGALHALRELQLVAGRDVSVIGFDDHTASNAFGFTTIRQPVRDIGRLGARLMLDQLAGSSGVRHHPIDLNLVERITCGAPPS